MTTSFSLPFCSPRNKTPAQLHIRTKMRAVPRAIQNSCLHNFSFQQRYCATKVPADESNRKRNVMKGAHMNRLEGKIALITGGSIGIGFATAKEFVNEGAYVFITGRRDAELAKAAKEIGKNVSAIKGDVSNLADLDRLFAQIQQEKGKLDVVFANAGVAKLAPLGSITEELYDSIFDINVKGMLFTVQKALP